MRTTTRGERHVQGERVHLEKSPRLGDATRSYDRLAVLAINYTSILLRFHLLVGVPVGSGIFQEEAGVPPAYKLLQHDWCKSRFLHVGSFSLLAKKEDMFFYHLAQMISGSGANQKYECECEYECELHNIERSSREHAPNPHYSHRIRTRWDQQSS